MVRYTRTGRHGERYKSSFMRMGAIQILASILAIVFEIVTLSFYDSTLKQEDREYLSTIGTGIWCGVIFLISGVSVIVAAKKLSFFPILFALISAILAFVFAIVLLSIEIYISKYYIPATKHNTFGILHVMLCIAAIMMSIPTIVQIVHLSSSIAFEQGLSSLTHVRVVSNPIEFTHNTSPVTQTTVFVTENTVDNLSQSSRQAMVIDYYTTNASDASPTEINHKLPAMNGHSHAI